MKKFIVYKVLQSNFKKDTLLYKKLVELLKTKQIYSKECPEDNEVFITRDNIFALITVDNIRVYNIESGLEVNKFITDDETTQKVFEY